ncbi:hypothetical protein ACFRAO_32485 [Streptomyces sp. NPDC056656]|uniref:hypothetical protein n=1 Tax=Streptomyces sp. NPDC056656 TaxID=3345895 RepID=UPI00367A885D
MVPSSAEADQAYAVSAGGNDGPDEDAFDDPSSSNRPVLAGVAIVGVVLLAIPLLLLAGSGRDGDKNKSGGPPATVGAHTELNGDDRRGLGDYAVMSPSPKSSRTASASPSPSADKPKGRSTAAAESAQAAETAKPPRDTAAGAVMELGKNDPSGRHICYRAYVSGKGWQKPVCDGAMAGTTKQNRPIKALNIAVTGSDGSSANAFVHNSASKDGKGMWMPQWTGVKADDTNNYIGSTKKSAPNMSGFAINIGTGRICQTAKVHSLDWGGKGCTSARPGYIFGGALSNDRYLEAVKLTV